jgi:hypothetical protein
MSGPDDCAEITDEIKQIDEDIAGIDEEIAHTTDPVLKARLEREKRVLGLLLGALLRERRQLGC